MRPPILVARRVLRGFSAGGSFPILAQTDEGLFVVKLRGSAQGMKALVAELVVASLAQALGLPALDARLIVLEAATPTEDHNDELADLLEKSRGLNVGFPYLEGATDLRLDQLYRLPEEQAVRLLWFDRFVENTDRTSASPNLILHRGAVRLIDHGAALVFQHSWQQVTEQSPRDPSFKDWPHLFSHLASRLPEVDEWCTERLSRDVLTRALGTVPDELLVEILPGETPARVRAGYVAYLYKRLKESRPFL